MGEVAPGGVDDALGFPGGARGVEDEEHRLAVHRLGRAPGRLEVHQLVPPVIPALGDLRERVADPAGMPLDHDDVADRGAALEGLVGVPLERHHLAPAVAPVRGDEADRAGVVDPVAERLCREAPEHHRVHGADAGAAQHRDRGFGNHGQIDCHPVARFDAERLERIGAPVDLPVQVPVGEDPPVPRLALPDDRRLVAPGPVQVTIEAVGRNVELPSHEPLRVRPVPLEDCRPRRDPVQGARLLLPEAQSVRLGTPVELGLRVGLSGERRGRWEPAGLQKQGSQLIGHGPPRCGVPLILSRPGVSGKALHFPAVHRGVLGGGSVAPIPRIPRSRGVTED